MRLAIFDLDGTVLRGNSWHVYFWWAMRRWPVQAPRLLAGFALRRARLMSARALREAALRPLRGMSRAVVAELGRGIVKEKLLERVRSAARGEIARAVGEGFEPVLATGAFDFLAEPLAVELGIRATVCSRLEFSNGACVGRIAVAETRGAVKASTLRALFDGRAVDWAASRAYSDDVEDAPLWALVGEPILVVSAGSRAAGRANGVKIVEWPDA